MANAREEASIYPGVAWKARNLETYVGVARGN